MFRAQKRNELADFVVGKGIAEGGHVLTTVPNLISHLLRGHRLPDIGQRWAFVGALAGSSMAMGAAPVAEEYGSRYLFGIGRQ